MKKRMILTAVALIAAGLLVIGCPSDPTAPPPAIENPDVAMQDGIYLYKIDEISDIRIEDGKTYEVKLDIKEVDYELYSCHFQGELYYTLPDDNKKYLQANNVNARPQVITDYARKYRITITAGNMGREPEKAVEEEGYTLTGGDTGIPVTTPADATQYLKLITKTPNWYKFGIKNQKDNGNEPDNWDIEYYESGLKPGFLGELTIREKPQYTYVEGVSVTANQDREDNGKGNIIRSEFTKLLDNPEGSLLRLSCIANVVASGGGTDSARPGWAIAEFGPPTTYTFRGQNYATEVVVPDDAPIQDNYSFTADVLIEDILSASDPDRTFLNVYNGGKVTAMKVMTPEQP